METISELKSVYPSLRTKLKLYQKRAAEIENYLSKRPDEWGKFQSEFNQEVNSIFREIMLFEKDSLAKGQEEKVYKLKRIFIKKIRQIFLKGVYNEWALRKPYGYAGDFKIIDDIYQNNPTSTGFARLFDNYFQMSAISVAVRNRKEDFKRLIVDFVSRRKYDNLKIMDLASGPCRELKELFSEDFSLFRNVSFDCYDNDENAIEYAKTLLGKCSNVNFFRENAVRLAFRKDITKYIENRYDLIYATGLFDYFSERLGIALVRNLRKILKLNGILAISNVRDKYSNPSVHYMEWVGDWNLVYREDDEFKKIFLEAGFSEDEIKMQYEQQGIMLYIVSTQTNVK